MGYIARVPTSVSELEENLKKLYENRAHISSIKANESSNVLECDLDWAANKFGGEAGKDFFIPIKRGKLREAKMLADKLLNGAHGPSRSEAQELYDMIDAQSK